MRFPLTSLLLQCQINMNEQLKIQLIGLGLAISTAIGCVAYEKIVKSSSYLFVGFLVSLSYVPFWVTSILFQSRSNYKPINKIWIIIFIISGCTGPLWYWLTRTKNVLTGATFEIKYIGILVVCSILLGEKDITINTIIGVLFAMASIYFISR